MPAHVGCFVRELVLLHATKALTQRNEMADSAEETDAAFALSDRYEDKSE